jgi:hypothetical protein
MRRLALHASALSDAEYDLYTASLHDLSLTDEDDGKASKDGEDAYFENIVVGVREARAWLRGRYSHVPAPTIDGVCRALLRCGIDTDVVQILRLFSPTLAHGDTLSGSEFFAALRLVVHAESGREVDRSLAFVQGKSINASFGLSIHLIVYSRSFLSLGSSNTSAATTYIDSHFCWDSYLTWKP